MRADPEQLRQAPSTSLAHRTQGDFQHSHAGAHAAERGHGHVRNQDAAEALSSLGHRGGRVVVQHAPGQVGRVRGHVVEHSCKREVLMMMMMMRVRMMMMMM